MSLTSGNIFTYKTCIKKDFRKYSQQISVRRGFNALDMEYTGGQMLETQCLILGLPKNEIFAVCENLTKHFGFWSEYDKKIAKYSEGNKQRLSCALAFLNSCPVLLLDEPFKYIDIVGRRLLCRLIGMANRHGRSTLLNAVIPRDCYNVATRLAVLSRGQLVCIDTTYKLSKRYSKGYVLKIKLKLREEETRRPTILKTLNFVELRFQQALTL